ncbi:ABC transporter permease [Microbacterium aoyamense]|uniref:Transport permease protein n=1 Tax=Microbacterium aoyamense TaxID=344166 RepID=A0ABN2PEC2_9MICO|nr:ABC transporter permease [Microbacterium aoyamense]
MARTIVTPPNRLNFPKWRELWAGREIIYRFGQRDILLRYRQTAVGVAWVFVQPLVSAGIFAIVFGGIAQLPSGGVPYFVFSFAGLLGWNLFNNVVSRTSPSLLANQSILSKVKFPRILAPISSLASVVLDFLVALALFFVIIAVMGINPGWGVFALPFWILMTLLLGGGIGLAAAAGVVKYRDVNYFLPWIMQVLMYGSPVAYSLEAVPQQFLWLFNLNPITWLLEGYRWSLLGQAAPDWWQVIALIIVSIGVAFAGLAIFQRMERSFIDIV